MELININLPSCIKLIIIKKRGSTNLVLINNSKKIIIKINNTSNVFIDRWTNTLIMKKLTKINYLNKKIILFLRSLNLYFFKKIKFKGKGFRIKMFKQIKIIKFFFGKSHMTFFFLKKIKKKRINKYKFILSSLKNEKLNSISNKIIKIKPINVYTLRGLKIHRKIIFKRKGKKGTYI